MNLNSHNQRILKKGWLLKQGGMIKSWHKRWFVLNGDCLFYFAKHDDIKALGSIFLPGNRVSQQPFNAEEPEKFTFQIMPGKGVTRMAPNHESYLLVADSEDERQSWIKVIRKVMYSAYGGAIFGQSIAETMKFEHERRRSIPFIIEQCVEFLRENGLETEGIFRLPGRSALMRELKEKYDSGERYKLDTDEVDIHTVSSLLKMYLRELPESIIPASLFQKFMGIAMQFQSSKNEQVKQDIVYSLKTAMSDLPKDNYNILKYLCKFLNDVALRKISNKMDAMNLATIFGPNIIRHMDDNPELFMGTIDITHQLSFMTIEYYEQVFVLDFESDKTSSHNIVPVDDLLGLSTPSESLQTPLSPVSSDFEVVTIPDRVHTDNYEESDTSPNNSLTKTQPVQGTSVTEKKTESFHSNITLEQRDDGDRTFATGGRPIPPKRPSKNKRQNSNRSSSASEKITPDTSIDLVLDRSGDPFNGMSSNTQGNSNGATTETIRSENFSENSCPPHHHDDNRRQHCYQYKQYSPQSSVNNADANSTDVDSKVAPSSAQLLLSIAALKDELSRNKSKYELQVHALKTELLNTKKKHQENVETLTAEYEKQLDDLRRQLDEEKTARAEVVNRVFLLQNQLHEYDMRYGELK